MTNQVTDTPAVVPYAPKERSTGSEADIVDRAGQAILGLVSRAADTAQADVQEAREVAEKLADQLRVAHDQINKLEAKVRHYQDRADRAEKWLQQISSEIEQRFFDAAGRQPLIQSQIEMTSRDVAPSVSQTHMEEPSQSADERPLAAKMPGFMRRSRK
jgi:chromosome segregation ATPase